MKIKASELCKQSTFFRSLQPYVEAASLMKSSLKIEPLTKKIEKIENKIEPFGKSLKKTKSSRDLMKLRKQPEIFKLRKQPKQKSWDDILSERKKKCQIVAPKRVTYNFDKIPSNRNKTTRGVSKSRALKYKKQNVKTKCCKKKYCCAKKKPKKKKASKCKKPCPCKKLKGDCHCHNKKNLTENVINRQLQDYLRYKSKRKRKLKQGIEDFDINF